MRLKDLKKIFREEGRIPIGTSRFEMKYLYRLERGRRRYRCRKGPSIFEREEWEEAKKSADPSCDQTIEEIIASLTRKKDGQGGGQKNEIREGNFLYTKKKIAQKTFLHVGLTLFSPLIANCPGTIEGLFKEGIQGVKLVGRVN